MVPTQNVVRRIWRGGGARLVRAFAVTCATLQLGLLVAHMAAPSRSPALPAPPHAHLTYETLGYPDPDTSGPRWENFLELVVHSDGHLARPLAYQFDARAVSDDADFTAAAYSLRNAERRRAYLSVSSAFLDYQATDQLRLRLGMQGAQVAGWSLIDELKPANLMTPRDASDPFRRIDQGVPAISGRYERGSAYLDLFVVPLMFTLGRLPQGRWSIVPAGVELQQELPPVRWNETQAGARVGAQIAQLDVALIGYVGRDSLPIFVAESGPTGGRVIDRYPGLQAGGANASQQLGEQILVRAEVVYFVNPHADRDNFVQSAGGFDVNLPNWTFILNYLRDDRSTQSPAGVVNAGERRFFQSFLFGEVRYDAGWRLQGRLRGGYDFTERFWLLQPEISYRLLDDPEVSVALTGEIIDAARPSYFDMIRHEDRLGTRLQYHFF